MGCQAFNKSCTPENTLLSLQEQSLGFRNHIPSVLEAHFYRIMKTDFLSDAQFQALQEVLALDSRVELCYQLLKDKEGRSQGKLLLLFALLQSKGTDEEKAFSIWNLYSDHDGNTLPVKRLQDMIRDTMTLSLTLPVAFSAPSTTVSRDKLTLYGQTNVPKVAKAVMTMSQLFPAEAGKVSKATFLQLVRNKTVVITNTKAIRSVIEQTRAMPQKFAAAFQPGSGFQTELR
jgi:hypothetical protein